MLEDMKCPQCGQNEAFHIVASIWGRYDAEGFNTDDKKLPNWDSDWDEYASCICPQCQKSGIVADFQI